MGTHTNNKPLLEIISPWIARIIGFYSKDKVKYVKLRWFWFWNQIMEQNEKDNVSKSDVTGLCQNAMQCLNDNRYPPTNWDMFENAIDDETYTTDDGVACLDRVVFAIHDSPKFEHMIDGENVFQCDHFYNHQIKVLIKMNDEEVEQNKKRLVEKYAGYKMKEEEDDDDDDLDLNDIKKEDKDFSIKKSNKNKNIKKKEENQENVLT